MWHCWDFSAPLPRYPPGLCICSPLSRRLFFSQHSCSNCRTGGFLWVTTNSVSWAALWGPPEKETKLSFLSRILPNAMKLRYLPMALNGAYPLDMSQFGNLLNATRIPVIGKDELKTYPSSRLVVVARGGVLVFGSDRDILLRLPSYFFWVLSVRQTLNMRASIKCILLFLVWKSMIYWKVLTDFVSISSADEIQYMAKKGSDQIMDRLQSLC